MDLSKLPVRPRRARSGRSRLRRRYWRSGRRRFLTVTGVLAVLGLAVLLHLVGRRAAGEIGLGAKRRHSAELAAQYVRTADFEAEFVQPLRGLLARAARHYRSFPTEIARRIAADPEFRPHRWSSDSSPPGPAIIPAAPRHPVVRPENAPIETLRNLRESLGWLGLTIRRSEQVSRFDTLLDTAYLGPKLAELEKTLPGICPHGMAAAFPETQEILRRGISRSLEITPPELVELVYCSQRTLDQVQKDRRPPDPARPLAAVPASI